MHISVKLPIPLRVKFSPFVALTKRFMHQVHSSNEVEQKDNFINRQRGLIWKSTYLDK